MNLITQIKRTFTITVSYLYIFLFTYAAISKWLDYENFLIQVGQSPLLTAFARPVTVGVPLVEMIIVVLLCLPKYRITGLYLAFALMVMFTAYIFLILNYSSFVPCSCGGILEKMGWTEHLLFNIVFAFLALGGILLSDKGHPNWLLKMKRLYFTLFMAGTSLVSFLFILVLFFISEKIVHERNAFSRRFLPKPEPEYNKIDLQYNSLYFAGFADGTIYLGSNTVPRNLTIIDTAFREKNTVTITPDKLDFPFLAPRLTVDPPAFFLYDGTVPCIYKGNTTDWNAYFQTTHFPGSGAMIPMEGSKFAIRQTSLKARSNQLTTFDLNDSNAVPNKMILPKQEDGIFDTDGIMLYNHERKELQYVFYYRNQYLVFDEDLKSTKTGKTIDTVSQAKLKVVATSDGESRMAAPALQINSTAATAGKLLFIKSDRIGKYEDKEMLEYASVIDIYDTTTNQYLSSMYIYHIGKSRLKSFYIYDHKLYALSGRFLSVVKLKQEIIDAMH